MTTGEDAEAPSPVGPVHVHLRFPKEPWRHSGEPESKEIITKDSHRFQRLWGFQANLGPWGLFIFLPEGKKTRELQHPYREHLVQGSCPEGQNP